MLRRLRLRFGEPPAHTVAFVEAAELAARERWAERVLTAGSLDEARAAG